MTTFTITSFKPYEPTNFFGKLWQNLCLKFSEKAKQKNALSLVIYDLGQILHSSCGYKSKDAIKKIDEAIKLGADQANLAKLIMSAGLHNLNFSVMDKVLDLNPQNKEKNALAFGAECFKAGQIHVKLYGHGDRATWARNSFIQAAKMFEIGRWSPNNFWAEHEEAMKKTEWLFKL